MKNQLTELIVQKLNATKEELRANFLKEHPIKVARHFVLDDLLPAEIAEQIYASFPKPNQMYLLSHYGQLKLRYGNLKTTASLVQDINSAIQNPKVVELIGEITGIRNQISDPSRFAGGVSTFLKGYYLNPHIDNSHDMDKKFYRTVNVLYYVSPNWSLENGGNYELWDESISDRIIVPCLFNRLLVMETTSTSWHSVNTVLADAPRCCVFNYFFSKLPPEGKEYYNFHSLTNSLYRPRPEHKVRRQIANLKVKLLGLWR